MDFCSVFEVPKNSNKSEPLYVHVKYNSAEKNMKFLILDMHAGTALKCQLDDATAKTYSENFEMPIEKYWDEIQEPMRDSPRFFHYTVENSLFSLKKVCKGNEVSFNFFSLPLTVAPPEETKFVMLSEVMKINTALRSQVEVLTTENKTLVKDRDALSNQLDELNAKKLEWENTLYTRFLVLLNAKKERILELERSGPSTSSGKRARQEGEEYDEDTDVDTPDTDEMEEPQDPAPVQTGPREEFPGLMDM